MLVSALSSLFLPLEQSQAQLFIHVYPSQDNPTSETLWIFSGTGNARTLYSVRNSASGNANRHRRDTWEVDDNSGDLYAGTEPNNLHIALSPLFSSSNTNDIESIQKRIPGGVRTNITFAASATNTPTITIGSGSRTIPRLFLNDDTTFEDQMGIRVSGSNLPYSSGNSSAWVGAGILNKPIGDFSAGIHNNDDSSTVSPDFASLSSGSVRVVVNSQVIPEPQEYALIFGLFALGFVIVRRRFLQKHTDACG